MADTNTGAINTEVIDNAQTTATAQQPSANKGTFVMNEDNAWAILMRNEAVTSAGTYEAQIATVTTADANRRPLIDAVTGAQYGIVNLRLQTAEQQEQSEALMEAGDFAGATNNTLNFRILPDDFGKFTRGAMAVVTVAFVDSVRQGKEVLAITSMRPQEAVKANVGRFADRKKAILEAKREAYLASQANNIANTEPQANPETTEATTETPAQEQA